MADLDFITDKQLRENLENSIEYIYALYEQSKGADQKPLYKEETYRVIILYVISAIEAVLLFFYKQQEEKIKSQKYKFINPLPSDFIHKQRNTLRVIIAVQEEVDKEDYEIGLHDLVMFFKSKNLIKEKTAKDILDANNMRNTLHLSKPRSRKCGIDDVESALNLLVHTIKKAPASLKVK